MLKQRNEQIQLAVRLGDAVITVVAFFVAYWLRRSVWLQPYYGPMASFDTISWILAASLVLHIILYPFLGFYQPLRIKPISKIISAVLKVFITEFFILGSLIFIFQAKATSRYFFGLFLAINYSVLLFQRISARVVLANIRQRGYNFRQVLIVGTGKNAEQVLNSFKQYKHWGYTVCGVLREPNAMGRQPAQFNGVDVLGSLHDFEKIVKRRAVDEVFFALDKVDPEAISEYILTSESLGIPTRFSLGFFNFPLSKVTFNHFDHLPVVTFYTTLRTPAEAFLKRFLDIFVSAIGLLITGILYPIIALLIKREGPGPVIFKQVRIGENGRKFKCYKFRTMALDAETRKRDLADQNLMEGPIFKVDNDPRVTKIGAFLRKSSLDELPQFFNILRGDMSVVGTRPPTPDEVEQYKMHFRRRISIRPGLTGLWQISGRNDITRFEDILALDLQYIDRWSLSMDLWIIFRTIWVVLFGKGAR